MAKNQISLRVERPERAQDSSNALKSPWKVMETYKNDSGLTAASRTLESKFSNTRGDLSNSLFVDSCDPLRDANAAGFEYNDYDDHDYGCDNKYTEVIDASFDFSSLMRASEPESDAEAETETEFGTANISVRRTRLRNWSSIDTQENEENDYDYADDENDVNEDICQKNEPSQVKNHFLDGVKTGLQARVTVKTMEKEKEKETEKDSAEDEEEREEEKRRMIAMFDARRAQSRGMHGTSGSADDMDCASESKCESQSNSGRKGKRKNRKLKRCNTTRLPSAGSAVTQTGTATGTATSVNSLESLRGTRSCTSMYRNVKKTKRRRKGDICDEHGYDSDGNIYICYSDKLTWNFDSDDSEF